MQDRKKDNQPSPDEIIAEDKDIFARIWDSIFGKHKQAASNATSNQQESPKDYEKQAQKDHAHSVIVFMIIFLIAAGIIIFSGWLINDSAAYTQDHIFVPAATYDTDQSSTVITQLTDMGFRNITEQDSGITAYGTQDMCNNWESSFWDTNISDNISVMDSSSTLVYNGIISMTHDDDWTTLTIQTITNDSSTSTLGYIVSNSSSISEAITASAEWCAVLHDGQSLHISFTDQNNEEYWSCDASSKADIIRKLQERDTADAANDNSNENNSSDSSNTSNENADNSADNPEDSANSSTDNESSDTDSNRNNDNSNAGDSDIQ